MGRRADETMCSSGQGREGKADLGCTDAMAGDNSPPWVPADWLNSNTDPGKVFAMWQRP